jgi:transposase
MKIIKEYQKLIIKRGLVPKEAARRIHVKYGICRKSIYNWLKRFKDMPIK